MRWLRWHRNKQKPAGLEQPEAQVLLRGAEEASREQDWRRTARLAHELLKAIPQCPDAIYLLAQAQFHLGQVPRAARLLAPLASRQHPDLRVQSLWAEIAERQSQWLVACRAWSNALVADPQDTHLATHVEDCARRAGMPELAAAVFLRLARTMACPALLQRAINLSTDASPQGESTPSEKDTDNQP